MATSVGTSILSQIPGDTFEAPELLNKRDNIYATPGYSPQGRYLFLLPSVRNAYQTYSRTQQSVSEGHTMASWRVMLILPDKSLLISKIGLKPTILVLGLSLMLQIRQGGRRTHVCFPQTTVSSWPSLILFSQQHLRN